MITTVRYTGGLEPVCSFYSECLTDIRQSLCAPRLAGKQEGSSGNLAELLNTISTSVIEQLKHVLTNLKVRFISYLTNESHFPKRNQTHT